MRAGGLRDRHLDLYPRCNTCCDPAGGQQSDCLQQQQGQQQQSGDGPFGGGQMHTGNAVSIDGLLRLWPAELEAASWRSPSAVRLLRVVDFMSSTYAVGMNSLLVKVYLSHMKAYQLTQALVYLVLAVLQLALMTRAPGLYQQHRFKIALFNRTLRLLSATANAAFMSVGELRQFETVTGSNTQWATNDRPWLRLTRILLGLPMFYLSHANIMLPFAFVLVAQLWTLAVNVAVAFRLMCLVLDHPGNLQRCERVCQVLKVTMHYLSMLLGRHPREAAAAAAQECRGINGLVLVSLYVSVCVLVVLPCLVVYSVEARLKLGFIKQQGLTLQHAWPCLDSRLIKGVVLYGVVVGCYMACESVMLVLQPMQCSSAGTLTMLWANGLKQQA